MDNRSDGQHRDDGTPMPNNGQRQRHLPGVDAGQISGGEAHSGSRTDRAPHGPAGDIATTVIPPNDVHRHPRY